MRRAGLIVSLLALLLASGCDTGTRQRLNCICLIDYSGSLPEDTLRRYVEIISNEVFRRLGAYDRLVVLPIDEGAKTEAVKLVYDDRAEQQFSFQTDGYAHAKDSVTLRLKKYADVNGPKISEELIRQKTLREKYTYFTDIFSALEQVAGLVERDNPDSFWDGVKRFVTGTKRMSPTNVILIFSDMIQETNDVTFAGPDGCTPEEARNELARLHSTSRIPDLHGCIVFVNGRTGKNNTQVENIQAFWTRYFKDAGADLVSYDYDSGPQITTYLIKRTAAAK
jgi:hypothetical protein